MNWLTQLLSPGCTKNLGDLENTGSFKVRVGGWYFSFLPPEELLLPSFWFTETQEGTCTGSWEICSHLTGWEERRKVKSRVCLPKPCAPSCVLLLSAAASTLSWHFVVLNTRALKKFRDLIHEYIYISPLWAAKVNRILHNCTFHSYEQKLKAKMGTTTSN